MVSQPDDVIRLEVPLSPDQANQAIRQYATDWHERRLPQRLRDDRIFRLAFRSTPPGFRLRFDGMRSVWIECVGEVMASGGGSVVTYRLAAGPRARQMFLGPGLAILAWLVLALIGRGSILPVFTLGAIAMGIQGLLVSAWVARDRARMAPLVDELFQRILSDRAT